MLNNKEAVNSIYLDEDASFYVNTDQYDCVNSSLCDPHHKHIITGDLRITKNKKVKKLLTKGTKYKKTWTMNFSKALTEITSALDTSIEAMTLKYTTSNFKSWKEKFLANVKKKITELKKQNLNKQNQYCVTQMLKSIWKNFTENLILSLLIKPQVV